MHSNDLNSMSANQIARTNGEPIDRLAFSGEYHRRKAKRAGDVRKAWIETGCEFLMTLVDFKMQGRRNKILKGYGREAVYLPGEGKPNTKN